jgi:hypothetical protein
MPDFLPALWRGAVRPDGADENNRCAEIEDRRFAFDMHRIVVLQKILARLLLIWDWIGRQALRFLLLNFKSRRKRFCYLHGTSAHKQLSLDESKLIGIFGRPFCLPSPL